ncbi:hypothetical protein [Knoellia sp. p5-6-4]|uniref:hypothetical protein n=1 Tax=unclassified Knoellia TaxID=2618719 RepID=UPI0023D9FBC6|nr:hypothetical protein [Knoellia sp. p5-6-4]MDF2146420.1 hypothetical protein [Knoellia sp. p5-6-4]
MLAIVAFFGVIGADLYWAVAMGRYISKRRSIPEGIPFAVADSSEWNNVPVLAELVLALVASVGPQGLIAMNLVLVGSSLALLAWSAARESVGPVALSGAVALAGLGALATVGVIRLQALSLLPFVIMLVLLRSEHANPSPRVWWLVPLCSLWSNLHGAILLGVGVIGAYLLFSRVWRQPKLAVTIGLAVMAALWLTPAGPGTGEYYVEALTNAAAARDSGLWARPDLGTPLDLMMVLAASALLLASLRRRRPLWEYIVLVCLVAATAEATRHGVWLLLFLVTPAALGFSRRSALGSFVWSRAVTLTCTLMALCLAVVGLSRGSAAAPDPAKALLPVVRQLSDVNTVVLADEPLAESLAAAGVRVWMSNPIDAFSLRDQDAFLDFLEGRAGSDEARSAADVVLVESGTAAAKATEADERFLLNRMVSGWLVYVRR